MLRKMMRAKIHRAAVTQCDPDYVGSITIDAELLREVGIAPNEAVSVYDIDNAARFETYVIRGEPSSGTIGVNGAAAKLVALGDRLIIVSYGYLTDDKVSDHVAPVLVVDAENRPVQRLRYDSQLARPMPADA